MIAGRRHSLRTIGAITTLALLACAGCRQQSISGRKPEKVIGDHGLGPGQFVYPRAITVAPDGCIFVVDKTARIQRFSADGEFETSWQMPEWDSGKPTGLTVDAQNRLLVADTHYHRVIIFDRDGHELARFGTEGEGPGQFILPTHVAVAPDGEIYVGEYGGNDRISRFSPTFEYLGSFGGRDAGEASLMRPQSLCFDSQGVLWVADAVHHRLCRFTREGTFLGAFGTPGRQPGQIEYPYDFAFCADGTVLVAEFGNNRLQRFDTQGHSLEVWGSAGRGPGQLAYPWGVALGRNGRVYVVDAGNNRVQMFRM